MHWTYESFTVESDLEQGDFLCCTDSLRRILGEVHPHFCDSKYLGFVVSTQSCDLVRRREEPKARYINVAVVRSLKAVLPTLLEHYIEPVVPGVFRRSQRGTAKEFLSRLINQNEQTHGLFYLHPDADIGLGESAVVFLRVSVALRAQHYSELLIARRGRLKVDFRNKFGWLLGNLYGRAASPDWHEHDGGKAQMEELMSGLLDSKSAGLELTWLPDDLIAGALEAGVGFPSRNEAELLATLEQYRAASPLERLRDEVTKEALKIFPGEHDKSQKLGRRIFNNGLVKKLLRS